MTIRFAAAIRDENPIIARILGASVPLRPGNDNHNGVSDEKLMRATLRHFALHGLSAARQARENAEIAWHSEDMESYVFWLSVCRMLDRRMADRFAGRMQSADKLGEKAGKSPRGNCG